MAKRHIRGGRGYLTIDNRASGGSLQEFDTLTCNHCGRIVALNKDRKRTRNWCPKCDSYTCDGACSIPGYCAPTEQCVILAQKYPGLPSLSRGYHGELLIDPSYLTEGKLY
jgi:hypothetical protein